MRVLVTGASGLIGTALTRSLSSDGHDVRTLVRRDPRTDAEFRWDPARRTLDATALTGVDAVVHLAGAGVGDKRWSDGYKKLILSSRVDGTTTIATALAALPEGERPATLVSASAVGFYGDRGDTTVDETDAAGTGFLADVVQAWEGATRPAADAGIRVTTVRTGLVLSREGGLLDRILPIFKAGLGGRLGSGNQWMPVISLDDEVRGLTRLIEDDSLSGPVNLCGPTPVTNREFTAALGKAVHRPAVAFVPGFALRVALGGFADEGALVSQRVLPARLQSAGFTWEHPGLEDMLAAGI